MTRDQIERFEYRTTIELTNETYTDSKVVLVEVYQDEETGRVYQLDKRLDRYKTAKDSGPMGKWIKVT